MKSRIMDQYILSLGFRADGRHLARILPSIVKDFNVKVYASTAKYDIIDFLKEFGKPIPKTKFSTQAAFDVGPRTYETLQFICDNAALFICSDVIREASDGDAAAVYDGYEFADLIMPNNHRTVLHFQNHYRRSKTPELSYAIIEEDFSKHLYHLPRDISTIDLEKNSDEILKIFIESFFRNNKNMPFDDYMKIISV
jgi:hypothetical protein